MERIQKFSAGLQIDHSAGRRVVHALFAFVLLSLSSRAGAQTELRPSEVGERLDPQIFLEKKPYNLKLGPVDVRFTAALETSFNDNVTASNQNPVSDVIVTPSMTIGMFWQLTPVNSLRLDTRIAYTKYLIHPDIGSAGSPFTISPNSDIEYKVFIGAFEVGIHDRFSLQQEAVSQPPLNNSANIGLFTNDMGLNVIWYASYVFRLEVGYDHTDLSATNSSFNFEAYSQDQITMSAKVKLESYLTGGLEGSAASTRYSTNDKPDAMSLHVGPFFDIDLTHFSRLRIAGGYQGIQFGQSTGSAFVIDPVTGQAVMAASNVPVENSSSYYFNFELNNQLTKRIHQSLSGGRESGLGITSSSTSSYYFRYAAIWNMNDWTTIRADAFTQFGTSSGGVQAERYRQMGFELSAQYQMTKHLTTGLAYRYIHNTSNIETSRYSQNVVTLSLGYQF